MNLNATLIAQLVVFFILGWFTMKYVWPPIVKALDERSAKIAEGLAAADKAKADLALAEKKAVEELRKAREEAAQLRAAADALLVEAAQLPGVRDLTDDDVPGRGEMRLALDREKLAAALSGPPAPVAAPPIEADAD